MFYKLALKNVTRSLKDYSVYFLTLTFGVCLFYVFNSLEAQWVMEALNSGSGKAIVGSILTLVDVFSVFVSVVLAFLMLYANGFMVRRRKKELGTYLLLGLSQGKISSLLFLETLLIGLLSLGVGLVLGILLSQFISVFTAGLFQIAVPEFHFVFSGTAFFKTLLHFCVLFVIIMLFNSVSISRCKLIDLLQAEKRSENLRMKSLKSSVVLFLLGVGLLIAAYAMLLTRGILNVDPLFFLMLGLGTAGTLLFFRSLSGFLLRLFQANKKLYYRGLNMFTLRQFASRVSTNYVSTSIISLMLLLAIGITACSVGLNTTLDNLTNAQAPYDFYLSASRRNPEGGEHLPVDIPAVLKEVGFDPEEQLDLGVNIDLWFGEFRVPERAEGERKYASFDLLPLSNYNNMRALVGKAPIALEAHRYGQVVTSTDFVTELMAGMPALELQGYTMTADPDARFTEDLSIGYNTSSAYYLIVPDEALVDNGWTGSSKPFVTDHYYMGTYRADLPKETTEALLQASISPFYRAAFGEDGGTSRFNTKLELYMETMGSKILVLFMGIYLGIVFLLCSAAVLALQQLSQAADNAPRYRILSRLGAEEKDLTRSVYVQVLLAFLLPLLLAIAHSVVGMTAANAVIAAFGKLDSGASSAVTAAFILVIYGAYFLATCWGSRRIARGR